MRETEFNDFMSPISQLEVFLNSDKCKFVYKAVKNSLANETSLADAWGNLQINHSLQNPSSYWLASKWVTQIVFIKLL